MKSSLQQLKWWLYFCLVCVVLTFILYRPGIYYYLRYDSNPQNIEFSKISSKFLVIDGIINGGNEFTYGTGKTIFADNKFSLFGYSNLDKTIYKINDRKIAICNSKYLGNCLISDGDEVGKFQESLSK